MIGSGLDLNGEAQNLSRFRTSAECPRASRHALVCAGHGPFAALHVSPLRGSPSRRAQGAGILLFRSVLRHGLPPVDSARVPACNRSQLASEIGTTVSHGSSLQDACAQHAGQRECSATLIDVWRVRAAPDWYRLNAVRGGIPGGGSGCHGLCFQRHHRRSKRFPL